MAGSGSWREVWAAYVAFNRALLRALGGWRPVLITLAVVCILAGAAWGGVRGLRAWAPESYEYLYDQMKLVYAKHLRRGVRYRFHELDPGHLETDVAALIRIHTLADAARLRAAAIDVIWGGTGFPMTARPARIEKNIELGRDTPSRYIAEVPGLTTVDAYTSMLEHDLPAEMYLMHAPRPNGRLVVYLEGHNGPFWLSGRRTIGALLEQGYDVLGVSMPVYTATTKAQIETLGPWRITNHIDLAMFERPMATFFQPVAEALNAILPEQDYRDVFMLGFSGGAWTATVYAAIDPRIRRSYQVSGTYPMYLRRYPSDRYDKPREWSDFEATYPPLIKAVNYLEFYVLASLEQRRRHVQVLSQYDACCFGGLGWTTYVDIVRERVRSVGPGAFDFVLDTSHAEHKLSKFALGEILADMAKD
ncbi:MAG: hypothetical protein QNJ94_16395 [Alphaproteobacteria bacterium]|nr:hypothetical protein [Alphaproteobacteria bacterium]